MEFSIKKYYNLQDELTNKEIIDIFLVDLDFYFYSFKKMLQKVKDKPESFVYPKNCSLVVKKMKYWTIIMCIFLEKFTNNPVFLTTAETFLKNEKVCTIDTFWFFLKLFNEHIDNNNIHKEIINAYFEILEANKDLSYKASVQKLLKIDEISSDNQTNEKLVNLIIK